MIISKGAKFYNARWYDPYLNQFTQPDSIIPDPNNPADYNRYAYVRYNPVNNSDPSGHACYSPGADAVSRGNCGGGSSFITWNIGDRRDLTGYLTRFLNFSANHSEITSIRNRNAQSPTGLSATGLWDFSQIVKDGAPFDIKVGIQDQIGSAVKLGDTWYEYSTPGNIAFGFYGAAAGFDISVLLLGAGYAQTEDWLLRGREFGDLECYLDTCGDMYALILGYVLYNSSALDDGILTTAELEKALESIPDGLLDEAWPPVENNEPPIFDEDWPYDAEDFSPGGGQSYEPL